MNGSRQERVDEVSKHYEPVKTITAIGSCLFWVIAALSLCMFYVASLGRPGILAVLQAFYIVFVLVDFGLSQISRLYLFPKAENMRRNNFSQMRSALPCRIIVQICTITINVLLPFKGLEQTPWKMPYSVRK